MPQARTLSLCKRIHRGLMNVAVEAVEDVGPQLKPLDHEIAPLRVLPARFDDIEELLSMALIDPRV